MERITKKNNKDMDFYRGISKKECIESCEIGHLLYYSSDPMTNDWEVIEYALGDDASEMSEEQITQWIKNTISWNDYLKGVNLITDLQNAKGYSEFVVELELTCLWEEFSDTHVFAQNSECCKIIKVHYKNQEYSAKEFLSLFK